MYLCYARMYLPTYILSTTNVAQPFQVCVKNGRYQLNLGQIPIPICYEQYWYTLKGPQR